MDPRLHLNVRTGHSAKENSYAAGREAAESLGLGRPDFVMLFSSSHHDLPKVLEGAGEVLGAAKMIGCTTCGEIVGSGLYSKTVCIMGIESDGMIFETGSATGADKNPLQCGREAARKVVSSSMFDKEIYASSILRTTSGFVEINRAIAISFVDGFSDGASILNGLLDIYGHHIPIIGGSAADDYRMKKTYQFENWRIVEKGCATALISSEFCSRIGVAHGWRPASRPFVVTKCEQNVLRELDGKPAIDAYEEFTGKRREQLVEADGRMAPVWSYPLGMSCGSLVPENYIIRTNLRANPDGSIVFPANVPEGSVVRIMEAATAALIQGATNAAQLAVEQTAAKGDIAAAFIIECGGRRLILGERFEEELRVYRDVVGVDVPIMGPLLYGEIGPMPGSKSLFHNKTVVVWALSTKTWGDLLMKEG